MIDCVKLDEDVNVDIGRMRYKNKDLLEYTGMSYGLTHNLISMLVDWGVCNLSSLVIKKEKE